MFTCPPIQSNASTPPNVRSALGATSRIAVEQCDALSTPSQKLAYFFAVEQWAAEGRETLKGQSGAGAAAATEG